MISLVVLVVVTLLSRALGFVWEGLDTWLEAARLGLAAMFVVTGLSHFSARLRPDFVRMVPPSFPAPAALVTLTGGLELLGRLAATGLALLLVVLLLTNLCASRQAVLPGGKPPPPLTVRHSDAGLMLGTPDRFRTS